VTDCDVQSDPLPFQWSSTIKLKKNCKWAGLDDVYIIYSNPDETISGTCNIAVTLAGAYNKNDNIYISQSCYSFNPPLMKGANLLVIAFYTHHETLDDVLMYNFPIPGYVNIATDEPTLLSDVEKQEIMKKIKNGSISPQKLRTQ
jgi:hypothetical protein